MADGHGEGTYGTGTFGSEVEPTGDYGSATGFGEGTYGGSEAVYITFAGTGSLDLAGELGSTLALLGEGVLAITAAAEEPNIGTVEFSGAGFLTLVGEQEHTGEKQGEFFPEGAGVMVITGEITSTEGQAGGGVLRPPYSRDVYVGRTERLPAGIGQRR